MHNKVQDTQVCLRFSRKLLSDARAKALHKGMSLAEFVRYAVRRETEAIEISPSPILVKCPPPSTPVSANGALGDEVAAIVSKAANGDLESQRTLFRDRLQAFSTAGLTIIDAAVIATELVTIGRFMASHGEQEDVRHFAAALLQASGVLTQLGRAGVGEYLAAEAVSVLEQLAENGDDLAAVCSADLISNLPVRLMDQVRILRSRAENGEAV